VSIFSYYLLSKCDYYSKSLDQHI